MKSYKEYINFLGGIDLDSTPDNILKGLVREVWNCIWRGPVGNMRPEVVFGTNLVANSFLPLTGSNVTINAYYDAVKKRIFFFNYNTTGFHGIYIYNTLIGTFQRLLQDGTGTVGNILNFDASSRITSVDILYGDDPDGDVLYFLDTLGRPTQINIDNYLAGIYPAIERNFIDVIKAPPVMPPWVTYEHDYTVSANNLVNSLWKFAACHFFDNHEKSVISAGSIVPLPTNAFDPSKNIDKSQNARIAIYVQTGNATVRKIRIYGKQQKDGVTSALLIIDTLDKAALGISDNTVYKYEFFNTGNYTAEDPSYAVLDFDLVPQSANAQSLLNGNVPSYWGCLEGYNYINPSLNVLAANLPSPVYTVNGVLFFANTNGLFTGSQPQLQIVLTGAGSNDGLGNPITLDYPPDEIHVRAKSNGVDKSFSFDNTAFGFNQIPNILGALATAAVSAGWVLVSTGTNSIIVYYPTGTVVLQSTYIFSTTFHILTYVQQQLAHYPQAGYQYGIRYRDGAERTCGPISNIQGQVTTPVYVRNSFQIPEITINLSGFTPPPWAVTWELMRTDNLTFDKHFNWVSNQAFSNIGQLTTDQFAYFGISNIDDYNNSIKAKEGVIAYDFSTGDRIRISGLFSVNGTYSQLSFDYAVLGVVVDPVQNGIPQIGRFVQIAYPTADISASFKFDGSDDFQNYEILLYSYKAQAPVSQNVFYAIGQKYGIGNPGTNSAYHMGNVNDNIVQITDGDIYFRNRNVPVGNTYYLTGGPEGDAFSYFNTRLTPAFPTGIRPGNFLPPIPASPQIVTSSFTIGTQLSGVTASLSNPASYPIYSSADWVVFNTGANPLTVRFRATVPMTVTAATNFGAYAKILTPTGFTPQTILAKSPGLIPGTQYDIQLDGTVIVPPNGKLFILYSNVLPAGNLLVSSYVARLDVIKNVTIQAFDTSFSDIYSLKINADNKPGIVNPDARQTFNGVLYRFAEPAIKGTNINNANRFFDNNSGELDNSHGQVQRVIQWQRRIRIAQERKWAEMGVYSKFIKNNSGANELIITDTILDENNVQYFDGDFGVGNQPAAIAVNGFQIWYIDPVRGAICRLSLDGNKQISEEFGVQTYAGQNYPYYLNPYNYPYGGKTALLAVYNFLSDREGEVIFVAQPGTFGSTSFPGPGSSTLTFPAPFPQPLSPLNITGRNLAFNEVRNAFTGFRNYAPDALVCAENQLYSFSNGKMYIHNNNAAYANFYGTNYEASISMIFNEKMSLSKKYLATGFQTNNNKIWTAKNIGDITTSSINEQTGLQQISQLIAQDFEVFESNIYGAFLRDYNSGINGPVAMLEGDYLIGNYLTMKLTAPDNSFNFLFKPFIKWIPSEPV